MQNEQQFEQLMLQYNQLKNGAEEIHRVILNEDYDTAITMIKTREPIFLTCKCIRKFLELTPEQQEKLDAILEELRVLEQENIKILSEGMAQIKKEIVKAQKTEKIQQAYDVADTSSGNIVNVEE
ncbi:MAG: hypothetical protein MJ231_03915 [bacterium]|nr:hypothetical protein [bacterium]